MVKHGVSYEHSENQRQHGCDQEVLIKVQLAAGWFSEGCSNVL